MRHKCAKWGVKPAIFINQFFDYQIIENHRLAHNPKVAGSSPASATSKDKGFQGFKIF